MTTWTKDRQWPLFKPCAHPKGAIEIQERVYPDPVGIEYVKVCKNCGQELI